MNNDKIFNTIAEALLCDYSDIYYVDGATNDYITYSMDPELRTLKKDTEGKDFFRGLITEAEKVVHPDDWHIFKHDIQKENLLRGAVNGDLQSYTYRLFLGGKFVYHELRLIRSTGGDDNYFIIGVRNVDKEMRMRKEAERLGSERLVFNQIAQSLASRYDLIYYVDSESNKYNEFSSGDQYEQLAIPKQGDNFFVESFRNITRYVHPEDRDDVLDQILKHRILRRLKLERHFTLEYRLLINDAYRYTRLSVMWANDRRHIIVGVEDIDEEHRRETEFRTAFEKAMTDELTGVKNKNAYQDTESELQEMIDGGICQPFALLICDLNNLKTINDTRGHKAGDSYLKAAAALISGSFPNSTVFRIGGDEFAVLLRKNDYSERRRLLEAFRTQAAKNSGSETEPVIASGMAVYDPAAHSSVSEVFELADSRMYQNKKELKSSGRRDGEVNES